MVRLQEGVTTQRPPGATRTGGTRGGRRRKYVHDDRRDGSTTHKAMGCQQNTNEMNFKRADEWTQVRWEDVDDFA